MYKILLFIAVLGLGMSSCKKDTPPLSKTQMNQMIDSIIDASTSESDARARIDLERRIKIEVKVKVDSILNARKNPPAAGKAK